VDKYYREIKESILQRKKEPKKERRKEMGYRPYSND
jgi:hypothetical protein